jgi:ATP-dependent DNA ligase
MVLRTRGGLIEPCLPKPAKAPPSGPGWIHEIKHDGFRIIARRDNVGVRLLTRNGHDFSVRFPASTKGWYRVCALTSAALLAIDSGAAAVAIVFAEFSAPAAARSPIRC